MDPQSPPSPPEFNLTQTIAIPDIGYERMARRGLLARAQSTGDATFSIYRMAHLVVRLDPLTYLDQLAARTDWTATRSDSHTIIIRATGLFGTIEACGTAEHCSVDVQLWADCAEKGDSAKEIILAGIRPFEITDVTFSLHWRFLDGKGSIVHATTEERASPCLLDEAYPALGNVDEFIADYLKAPESVLVLQGPPGTGKTRLIRAILAAIPRLEAETVDVLYTGDSAVLQSDEVFLEFISGSNRAFVVEDADHLLAPRAGGNATLHRFLNIADGIASAQGKKIIFSTNLPNMRDIDSALVRPGRCFAHVYLDPLKPGEAVALIHRLSEETPELRAAAVESLHISEKKVFSVAEVYAAYRNVSEKPMKRRNWASRNGPRPAMGFV